MKKNFRNNQVSCFLLVIALVWMTGTANCFGARLAAPKTQESSRQIIHKAAEAVEEAWDEFHNAAIGGTLASPLIQTQIERQLHEARSLLMEARKAERRNDFDTIRRTTDTVMQLSHNIVKASREKKQ